MSDLKVDVRVGYKDFSLEIAQVFRGEGITAIFGPSGCGKTTLLQIIAGFERTATGSILHGGETWMDKRSFMPPHQRGVGYIFQDARLFPHLSVRGNLDFAHKRAAGLPAQYSIDDVLDILELAPLLSRSTLQLSGGEKQRVAIARALLSAPRLILADEPLAALDEARKAEILPYFERLRDEIKLPILYVSHSASEVARLATTVVALAAGQVVAQGPAEEVLSNPAVLPAGVRDAGALLIARVARHHNDGLTELDAGGIPLFLPHVTAKPGHRLRIRIAAHDVILSCNRPDGLSALNILPCVVQELRSGKGPGILVALTTPAGRLLAHITHRSAGAMGLTEGMHLYAVIKAVATCSNDIAG